MPHNGHINFKQQISVHYMPSARAEYNVIIIGANLPGKLINVPGLVVGDSLVCWFGLMRSTLILSTIFLLFLIFIFDSTLVQDLFQQSTLDASVLGASWLCLPPCRVVTWEFCLGLGQLAVISGPKLR